MKYAIIIPAGSGKTTLAKKYEGIYDIDQFQTSDLKDSCIRSLETGNWDAHNKLEYDMIHTEIENLPPNSIVLLHAIEKAAMYNLIPLGILKISRTVMLQIAETRGKLDGDWRKQITMYNWENTPHADIFDTFADLEKKVLELKQGIDNKNY